MTWTMSTVLDKTTENLIATIKGFIGTRTSVCRLKADFSSLFWPACEQGFASLVCRFSNDAARCGRLVRATGEVRGLRASGQLFFALGLAADAHQIGKAISRSVKCGTVRPAAAQATRSLTNWSAVWAGAELFGSGGALVGLATGPGAIVTSGVGALVGGYLGLFASEWIARHIEEPN